MTAALLLVCALAAPLPAQTADDRTSVSDASMARVRTALQKPPSKLTLADRPPDFTVSIWERQRITRLMTPILDFKVGPGVPQTALFSASPFGSQPVFSVDLLSMAFAAATAVNAARKVQARRAAIEDVKQTIAAYCAAQPNGGAGIAICSHARR